MMKADACAPAAEDRMRFAAFFRNLNLGRPRCPTREQLESAFLEAGASAAASFLTNGTIAFEATGSRAASKIAARACASMASACGLEEPAFLREMAYLQELVAARSVRGSRSQRRVRLLRHLSAQGCDRPDAGLPRESPRGDVAIVRLTGAEALCIARQQGKSPGSPNAFLEKALGLPATTRAWNTVVRLVDKHASRAG